MGLGRPHKKVSKVAEIITHIVLAVLIIVGALTIIEWVLKRML